VAGLDHDVQANFPMPTVKDIVGDLPPLDTGILWYPSHSDHIAPLMSYDIKEVIQRIPTEADYYYARKRKLIPRFVHQIYEKKLDDRNHYRYL
jgi:hypothetical protein